MIREDKHFFSLIIIARNEIDNFVFFFQIFELKQPDFREKSVFLLSGGGFTLPTPLVVRPPKKHFLCVSSLSSFMLLPKSLEMSMEKNSEAFGQP